ncbi:hypothetical protein SALBM311S_04572 [Streptomyces alboniger]
MSGGAYALLGDELHRHGLEYRNTDGFVTGTVTDEGRVVLAHRDPGTTTEGFAHASDRDAYLAMLQRFLDNADAIGGFLGGDLRSPRSRSPSPGWCAGSGSPVPRHGCAPPSPAAAPTPAASSSAMRPTCCGRPGCCTPDSPPTTPPAA